MKSWKIKLTGMVLTLGLLVSLISLMVTPAMAAPPDRLYFNPDPAQVACSQSIDVDVVADIDDAHDPVNATLLSFTFDTTCLKVTAAVGNTVDWQVVLINDLTEMNTTGIVNISTGLVGVGLTGTVLIATLTFECINCEEECTSALDLTAGEYNTAMMEVIYPALDDGSVTCTIPFEERVLVSGTTADCDLPPYPAGFEPRDDFEPCMDVCVWGYGFLPDQPYDLYIQPYIPDVAVAEGDPLDPGAGAPLGYPVPLRVNAAADGTIGPVFLFHAEENHICMYWEIVADMVAGALPTIYNADEDGLDAVALNEYGFHVVPEALTIILFGAGLAGLGSYVAMRRRKQH